MRGEPLEQPAPDPAPLQLVGDDEGDLGARRVAKPNPRAERDHAHGAVAVDQLADQRQALVAVAAAETARPEGVDADRALKAQVAALRGRALEEVDQRLLVGGVRRTQAQRRAVPQDDVFPVGDRNHAALWRGGPQTPSAEGRADGAENYVSTGLAPRFPTPPRRHDRSVEEEEALMKSIVLATDGSPSAAEATLRAVELAERSTRRSSRRGRAVNVPSYGYYGYADIVTEMAKMEHEHVDEALAQAKAVAAEAGVRCEIVHAIGPISEQICRRRKHQARMIVIGAHGWGAMRRVLHGSVSSAVLHEAPCPVLVVRAEHGSRADSTGGAREAGR